MADRRSLPTSGRPVFLMDGSAYIYRGYYGNRNLQRSDGFPTGSLYVVARILLRILGRERPTWFAFVKDGHGRNFRHDIYPQYKANRDAMPEDLVAQLDPIRRLVEALGLLYIESEGCEADDCIASLAARLASPETPVVILSGDKDLKQCLADNVIMWDPGSKQEKLVTAESFREEVGFPPSLWPDMQALMGDSSDNIPGVPGIGPKTAEQIFAICPGLEAVRDRFALLPEKFRKKLDGHLEDMFVWRRLTRLSTTACPELDLHSLHVQPIDFAQAGALLSEFELESLRRDVEALERTSLASALGRIAPGPITRKAAAGAGARAQEAPEGGEAQAPAGADGGKATPAPARGQRRAAARSLFDLIPDGAAQEEPGRDEAVPHLAAVADLPPCGGCRVAVLRPADGRGAFRVAVMAAGEGGTSGAGAAEFAWEGTEAALAGWAAGAGTIVVEDVKSLMAENGPWARELAKRASSGSGVFDLGLAAYLFDPEEGDYSWGRLAGLAVATDPEGDGLGDAALALGLEARDRVRMEANGLTRLYFDLELPLVPVLADMQAAGVCIDMPAFLAFLEEVQKELGALSEEIYAQAGTRFNLRSAQQLGELLYTRLGLPGGRRTKSGQYSTSQESLEKLSGRHPVVDTILRFRKLEKLRSTYLEPLPRLTDRDGRLHSTFNQEATATGRLSSRSPNLQNIPVRGPLGKRMRTCIVAGRGRHLVSCDYSQIELRVLAHMSRDEALLAAFRKGEDIHARTAALVYDLEPSEVTADQRRNAKTINFGLLYGMGPQKLARELSITTTKAKEFMERYFARLSGVKAFYEGVEKRALEDGFVTTLGGRRRLLPDIASRNNQLAALSRRQAVNTVIQGSAADIIKMAMLAVFRDPLLRELGARMVLQIHDELLVEVAAGNAARAGARVAALMEGVRPGGTEFLVPLAVDWGEGGNWGAAH